MEAIALVVVGAVALLALGWGTWLWRERAKLTLERDQARAENGRLEEDLGRRREAEDRLEARVGELSVEIATHRERVTQHEKTQAQWAEQMQVVEKRFADTFKSLAGDVMRDVTKTSNDQFLRLASERFRAQNEQSQTDLDARKRAVDELLKPISDTLKRTDEKLTALDKGRAESAARLSEHINLVLDQTKLLETETHRLVQSLRSPHVRGQWGEMTLRRVVELAGMAEHCDYTIQPTVEDDEGAKFRPDMVIHMPGDRQIVVDVKTPLSAYLTAIEADTEDKRTAALALHAKQLRQRVDELASKQYHAQFVDRTPDFCVLFVPGDHFLSAAMRQDPNIIDHAASRRVIVTTPVTLIALLKAVSFGWSQASLAEDARAVLKLGRELHMRVGKMTEHLAKMGRSLSGAVGAYNDLLGNVERRVIPSASKLAEHNVRSNTELKDAHQVNESPRLPVGATVEMPAQPNRDGGDSEQTTTFSRSRD